MKTLAATCLLVALLAGPAVGDEATPAKPAAQKPRKPAPTAEQLRRWVEQLDSASFVVREAAMRNLIAAGRLAIEPVSKAIDQGNPELNWRGVTVLKRLMEVDNLNTVDAAEIALERISELPRRRLATMASKALAEQRVHQHPRAAARIKSYGGKVQPATLGGNQTSTEVTLNQDWKGGHQGLRSLRRLFNLHRLQLQSAPIDDAGLKYVGCHETLVHLDLTQTRITDKGLVHLKRLVNLEKLTLTNNRVTDEGLAHLKNLTSIRMLRLDGTKITDEGLKHLRGMKNLSGLDLEGTKVTDEGLKYLKDAETLKWLSLDNTQVTDAGLKHLAGLKNLRRLYLHKTKVSDAAVKTLQESLSRLTSKAPPTVLK